MSGAARGRGVTIRTAMAGIGVLVVASACQADPSADIPPPSAAPTPDHRTAPATPTSTPTTAPPPTTGSATSAFARPSWLGTRVLPERPDGLGEVRRTPPELVDRRLAPPTGAPVQHGFTATVDPVPADVVARSTWTPDCPVDVADLRYLTMTFWGFDNHSYTGEMIVHSSVADDVVSVFRRLYDARFPIEEMRVVDASELDAPPTGDGNNTTAFVCRSTTLRDTWSEHAYGLAIDVNPFHNPYRRGDAVLPELASAYLDRDRDLPGMIHAGDDTVEAFATIGWGWGGAWTSLKDWQHFSRSGR